MKSIILAIVSLFICINCYAAPGMLDYSGDFTGSHGIPEPKSAPYINEIILYLEDNYKMVFNSFFDYGEVSLYHEDKIVEAKFANIKKGILKRTYK